MIGYLAGGVGALLGIVYGWCRLSRLRRDVDQRWAEMAGGFPGEVQK